MKSYESYYERINRKLTKKAHMIEVASGRQPADLVLKNAEYVNVFANRICRADIAVADGLIVGLGTYHGKEELDMTGKIVLPGLFDAHLHLESTMVTPTEFAKAVLPHGTTTVIADPHEIANVLGSAGIEYILQASEGLPVDVNIMLPSCVPATPLDEAGAELDYYAMDAFYDHPRVQGLAEMMNSYGVIQNDPNVISKIVAAQAHHKKIDGHAPDLSEHDLNAYVTAGIYSDHECSTADDAIAKIERGQFIMIREGTAAHNLEALIPLLTPQYADRCMFCCDDKHPSDLMYKGHIDTIAARAIRLGVDPIIAVKAASHNAARYFGLNNRGAIAPGYLADFAIIDSFERFTVLQTFKRGKLCYGENGVCAITPPTVKPHLTERVHATFRTDTITAESFVCDGPLPIIKTVPGEIITKNAGRADGIDIAADRLKMAVIERHRGTGHIGICYLSGYGLKSGAVATSISHDSHNLIVVGTNEKDMALAVNRVMENRGGIVVADGGKIKGEVALPIAGLMSEAPLAEVNADLTAAKTAAFALGVSDLIDPFMTLSFISLPVIPEIRLTTHGAVDVATQTVL